MFLLLVCWIQQEDPRVSGNWRLSPLGRSVLAKYNSEHDEINAAARSSNGSHTPTKREVPMQDDEDDRSSDTDEDESGSNSVCFLFLCFFFFFSSQVVVTDS